MSKPWVVEEIRRGDRGYGTEVGSFSTQLEAERFAYDLSDTRGHKTSRVLVMIRSEADPEEWDIVREFRSGIIFKR